MNRRYMKEELQKISNLKGTAKYRYVWDYYKLWIISLLAIVAFAFYMGNLMRTGMSEHWFYLMITNTNKDLGNGSALWQEYADHTGYDLGEKKIEFNAVSYFDYLDGNYARNNKYYEMFVAYTDAGTLDAVVMPADALEELGRSGRLLDLESEMGMEIAEEYGDRLIYCLPQDESYGKEMVAVGIDITDSRLMTDYQVYSEGTRCAIGIGAASSHPDAAKAFLDMILSDIE